MASKVQRRIRITGIILGVIPLSTQTGGLYQPLVWIFPALGVPLMYFFIFSLAFLPIAIALGLVDLGMTIASRDNAKQLESAGTETPNIKK